MNQEKEIRVFTDRNEKREYIAGLQMCSALTFILFIISTDSISNKLLSNDVQPCLSRSMERVFFDHDQEKFDCLSKRRSNLGIISASSKSNNAININSLNMLLNAIC